VGGSSGYSIQKTSWMFSVSWRNCASLRRSVASASLRSVMSWKTPCTRTTRPSSTTGSPIVRTHFGTLRADSSGTSRS
jgi:hypothetical protein